MPDKPNHAPNFRHAGSCMNCVHGDHHAGWSWCMIHTESDGDDLKGWDYEICDDYKKETDDA